MTKWKPEDYDPEPDTWPEEYEDVLLPPEEQEDWDLPPVREKLTRLACGE